LQQLVTPLRMRNSCRSICAKRRLSHQNKKFSAFTNRQNLSFPRLFSTSFVKNTAVTHQTATQLLIGINNMQAVNSAQQLNK
jgi:hypothetical protein